MWARKLGSKSRLPLDHSACNQTGKEAEGHKGDLAGTQHAADVPLGTSISQYDAAEDRCVHASETDLGQDLRDVTETKCLTLRLSE